MRCIFKYYNTFFNLRTHCRPRHIAPKKETHSQKSGKERLLTCRQLALTTGNAHKKSLQENFLTCPSRPFRHPVPAQLRPAPNSKVR